MTYKKYERSEILVTSCIIKVDRIRMRVNRMFLFREEYRRDVREADYSG